MSFTTPHQRRRLETLARNELLEYQLGRLNALVDAALPHNEFYAHKLAQVKRPLDSLEGLTEWPFTFKEELIGSPQNGEFVKNLTWPADRYARFHQTSGTSGRPMVVLDTPDDWQWILECWQYVLDAADVLPEDRALMAFSFGPHIGFWGAYEALTHRGVLAIPSGGMSSVQRLELARRSQPTIVCCTPSYALHLAEVGQQVGIDVGQLGVRLLLVAGEPGASVPSVRQRLIQLWNAEVHDHSGATEIGPWGYGDRSGRGLHIIESEFIAEFISLEHGGPVAEGEEGELVITTLGRAGCPVIRYRTGDVVRPIWEATETNRFVLLDGGVLGRTDDMMVVRGVNVFPSSIDHIVRSFPEVVEYRVTMYKVSEMSQLRIEVEDRLEQPERIVSELKLRLGLNVEVQTAPAGSLPRYEGKGKRFQRQA